MRDYVELVKALRYCSGQDNCGSRCPKFDRGEKCIDEIETEAADAIEELLDELTIRKQLPQWISVEERLPEGNGTRYEYDLEESNLVLVYGINHIGEMAYGLGRYIYDHDDPKDSGWNGNMDCDYDLDYCTVTHWMPLPEPPKENTHD